MRPQSGLVCGNIHYRKNRSLGGWEKSRQLRRTWEKQQLHFVRKQSRGNPPSRPKYTAGCARVCIYLRSSMDPLTGALGLKGARESPKQVRTKFSRIRCTTGALVSVNNRGRLREPNGNSHLHVCGCEAFPPWTSRETPPSSFAPSQLLTFSAPIDKSVCWPAGKGRTLIRNPYPKRHLRTISHSAGREDTEKEKKQKTAGEARPPVTDEPPTLFTARSYIVFHCVCGFALWFRH